MKETTTAPSPIFDVFEPERISLGELSNIQQKALLKILEEYVLNFNYIQHLEDCLHIAYLAQDYDFQVPPNFYPNNTFAIQLHQKAINIINKPHVYAKP